MSFKFSSASDEDLARSFSGLIKNGGWFKSAKQRDYFMKLAEPTNIACIKELFGVDMAEGQVRFHVSGSVRWADYGSRALRFVDYMFVLDEHGIVRKYKLGRTYSSDGHQSWVAPNRTTLEWARDTTATAPVFAVPAPVATEPKDVVPNEWVGNVGDKINIQGVLRKISTFQKRRMFYGDSDTGFCAKFDTPSGVVVYWNFPVDSKTKEDLKVGDKVTIVATIKTCDEFKETKQTVIQRPKFSLCK